MNTVIFPTENAVFKFALKEVKERLISKKTEYVPDKIARLLELISTDTGDTLFNPGDHHYFGFVTLDLISGGMGKVTCKICGKTYEAGQLKKFTLGHGKSPFNFKQKQKGGNYRKFNSGF